MPKAAGSKKMNLDHIGIVVPNLEEAAHHYADIFSAKSITDPIEVPSQKIRCIYVNLHDNCKIQLIEPIDSSSPVYTAMKRGGGCHHICIETDSFQETIDQLRKRGSRPLSKPFQGEGVNGRKAVFVMDSHLGLLEIVSKY